MNPCIWHHGGSIAIDVHASCTCIRIQEMLNSEAPACSEPRKHLKASLCGVRCNVTMRMELTAFCRTIMDEGVVNNEFARKAMLNRNQVTMTACSFRIEFEAAE
ncbi:unnamed protein product [Symbiodinium microadriaticum]|nr:unnamed protein product [Symbiodinium microadriaticum]